MPAYTRREIVTDGEVGVYHCVSRCVRRAFLCGKDALTGRSFEHRRGWIRRRLETLAGIFGIDVLGFAAMHNHLHVLLRNRPDIVATWSDEEIGRRWWRLTSAFDRITARQARRELLETSRAKRPVAAHATEAVERGDASAADRRVTADAWLCPIETESQAESSAVATTAGKTITQRGKAQQVTVVPRRASERRFLPMTLDAYLQLLDWTGRQLRAGKRGVIPSDLAPILSRLAVNAESWVATVQHFGRWFHRTVGQPAHLADAAAARGKRWFQGTRYAADAFGEAHESRIAHRSSPFRRFASLSVAVRAFPLAHLCRCKRIVPHDPVAS
jgi:hypothetical protein